MARAASATGGSARISSATAQARAAYAGLREQCLHGARAALGAVERDARAEGVHARGVVGLVGEERQHGERHAGREPAEHGAEAAVADHRRGVRHHVAWATQRSAWTFAGSGPSSAGSASRPVVTSTRTSSGASASIAAR